MEFQVMTYNIHHGKGSDGKLNLERIASVIEKSGADFVSLNEVDREFSRRSNHMDQISWMAQELNMISAFGPAITFKKKGSEGLRQYGNAFLSKYPILADENHLLYPTGMEGRSLLEVHTQFHGKVLKMFVTHLSLNPLTRHKQIDFITHKILGESNPVILMGDCNMKPGTESWGKITQYLQDVCHMAFAGPLPTYPSKKPKSQLDYIFVSDHLHLSSIEVVETNPLASDHLPLKATLVVKPSISRP